MDTRGLIPKRQTSLIFNKKKFVFIREYIFFAHTKEKDKKNYFSTRYSTSRIFFPLNPFLLLNSFFHMSVFNIKKSLYICTGWRQSPNRYMDTATE